MRRPLLVLLVLAAIGAAVLAWTLPARSVALDSVGPMPPTARGALHVHSRRSDGTGTLETIAAAASRAGLKFVVLTDHGDASREPELPVYLRGVLMIDAVEISTDGGHVVALGLPQTPYPLRGEARDVLDDIRRLGGFSIAAHPGSEKPELRWLEWTSPVDGLEWLNGDSEWRDERRRDLVQTLFTYPIRPAETLARMFDRPATILTRWDAMTARRRVVALAAGDAHARIGIRSGEPTDNSLALPLPAYDAVFRAVSISVSPVTLSGDAVADARAIVDAIQRGHVYSSVDGLAAPAALSFTARSGKTETVAGDVVPAAPDIELRVDTNGPADARIVLLKNGKEEASAAGKSLVHQVTGERAVYRTEVYLPGGPGDPPVPWILSNPLYVGFGTDPPAPVRPPATEFVSQYDNGPAVGFAIEASPRSAAAIDVVPAIGGGTQLSVRWAVGGSLAESPYAAIAMPAAPALSGYDRLTFSARADRPMRISVQFRVPTAAGDGERWHRSAYVDETTREVTVFFDEMTPRGMTSQRRPPLSAVRDLLFVIDTVNTKPGSSGVLWIDDVKYGR